MAKKKQNKKPKHGIWKEAELVPDTPQSMADGFRFYAETITVILNKFTHKQDDDALKGMYNTYRQTIENWRKLTKKYLEIDLPELPMLKDDGYYDVMVRLAEWCEGAARHTEGKSDGTWFQAKPVKLRVAVEYYDTTVRAITARIKKGDITSYRKGDTGEHLVKLPDVAVYYTEREDSKKS